MRKQRAARRTEAATMEFVLLIIGEFNLRQQEMSGQRQALENMFETVGELI
jgi:hypothetical protein